MWLAFVVYRNIYWERNNDIFLDKELMRVRHFVTVFSCQIYNSVHTETLTRNNPLLPGIFYF